MAVVEWKRPYQEPEEYGDYLVRVKGFQKVIIARYDHPIGQRETGWYTLVSENDDDYVAVDIEAWSVIPTEADWKRTWKEPESYGEYLVKVKGQETPIIAYFGHPVGERQTGWYVLVCENEEIYDTVDVQYWDELPK